MPHTSRFDVTNKQIEDMSLGDELTITIKGKIIELEAERSFGEVPMTVGGKKTKEEKSPPNVTVEVSSTKVEGKNAFSELANED